MTNAFLLLDPDWFPNPHKFDPERWIEDGNGGVRSSKVFLPFGKGTRNCVGLKFVSLFHIFTISWFPAIIYRAVVVESDVESDAEYSPLPRYSLATSELYLTIAHVFREFDLEVFETDESDITVVRDCLVGYPAKSSKGVRVKVVGMARGKT